MKNHYLEVIHTTDRIKQLRAFDKFLQQEMRRVEDQLIDMEDEDGSIPEENHERWNYEKGRLDSLSVIYGMVVQARITADDMGDVTLGE